MWGAGYHVRGQPLHPIYARSRGNLLRLRSTLPPAGPSRCFDAATLPGHPACVRPRKAHRFDKEIPMQHGTISRFVFASLLAAFGTTMPAAAVDLSGDYVGFALVPFTV